MTNRLFYPGTMAVINMTENVKEIKRVKIEYYNNQLGYTTLVVDNPEPLKVVGHTNFIYTNEPWSSDYWLITVEWQWANQKTLITSKGKSDFYCNISSSDNGLVLFSLHFSPTELGTINEGNYARVHFSNSSGCYEYLKN